jgi:hypothetical protein
MNHTPDRPTNQKPAIRDILHTDVENWRQACASDFYVLQAIRRAEAEIRSALYDATCNINIAKDVPPEYRWMFYDGRAADRKHPSRDRFKLVQALRACRNVIPTETAKRCLERIDRAEAEIDALLGPYEPGPEGCKAEAVATMSSPRGREWAVPRRPEGSWEGVKGSREWKPAA